MEYRYSSTLSLTSEIDGVGGQRHAPAALTPRKTRAHCIGGWVSSRVGLYGCRKSRPPPLGIRSPGRPACNESLYRLRYHGPHDMCIQSIIPIRSTVQNLPLSVLSVAVIKETSSALFWSITQRREGPIIETSVSFKGQEIQMTLEDGTDRLYRNASKVQASRNLNDTWRRDRQPKRQ
jgi:hypothetical protein